MTVMVILAISTGLVQAGAEGTILNLSKAMICAATVVVVLAQMIKSKKVPEKQALVKMELLNKELRMKALVKTGLLKKELKMKALVKAKFLKKEPRMKALVRAVMNRAPQEMGPAMRAVMNRAPAMRVAPLEVMMFLTSILNNSICTSSTLRRLTMVSLTQPLPSMIGSPSKISRPTLKTTLMKEETTNSMNTTQLYESLQWIEQFITSVPWLTYFVNFISSLCVLYFSITYQ